jgi:(1->4)-alpha-D-glucan 1-alpha-D-glucosylmutase
MKTDMPTAATIAEMAQKILENRHIPHATYRLQFNNQFSFRDAASLVPYLHDLGISDCYASPLLKPRPGSGHGYDISDHSKLNPELGSEADFDAFTAELKTYGMGLVLDMVPNHMGIDDESNIWWMDVLENGPSSIYANYFDIDWHPVKPELKNKVLLPILGDQYGNILESGQLQLAYEDGGFALYYYEHKFPISPRTYGQILSHKFDDLQEEFGEDNENVQELASILTAISYLPPSNEPDPAKVLERNREKEIIKRRIATLYQSVPEIQAAVDASVEHFNGTTEDPHSFDLLDALIDKQSYRLAFWRVATEEINYRRFFDINDLAAIRVEQKEVFDATHALMFGLLAEGKATGLRIDHPDGLWDPPGYFRQLQESFVVHHILHELGEDADPEEVEHAVSTWFAGLLKRTENFSAVLPLYVVAEKILSEGERLSEDWAAHGTTGYDFLNKLTSVFVDASNRKAFDKLYSTVIGREINFPDLVNTSKKMIMLVSMAGQINEISYKLERIAEKNRKYRDFTLNGLTFAIREVIAGLPVYRTYLTGANGINKQDRAHVRAAVREARRRNPRTAESVFQFVQDMLLLRNMRTFREEDQQNLLDFVMEMQQLTGPVMAKGMEDTAFYVYNRLVSLNEVGGHPEHFGVTASELHQENLERQQRWPHSMLTTSTHDTKRSEDVRARINVLSEIPEEWRQAVARWSRMNSSRKTDVNGMSAPERNDEYLLYQTLVGAWNEEAPGTPEFAIFRDRIEGYMQKAVREAKVHTSWVNPNEDYNNALHNFVSRVLDDKGKNAFLKDMMTFQRRVAFFGQFNALSQVLLKLTSPGMPDIYQGTELWDYSLVDPDNRRPVDYQLRSWLLSQLKRRISQAEQNLVPLARELLDDSADGRIKLYVISRTLNFRREHEQLFARGDYVPLEAMGTKQDNLFAFARTWKPENAKTTQDILVVVPRLIVGLTGGTEQLPLGAKVWKDTWLKLGHAQAGQSYENLFTGEVLTTGEQWDTVGLPLASVCAHFPVALLVRQ